MHPSGVAVQPARQLSYRDSGFEVKRYAWRRPPERTGVADDSVLESRLHDLNGLVVRDIRTPLRCEIVKSCIRVSTVWDWYKT